MRAILSATEPWVIRFGEIASLSAEAVALHVSLPLLAGGANENLFSGARPAGTIGHVSLFQTKDWLLGCASVPVPRGGIESVALNLYTDIMATTRGHHLCRVWNYVPAINVEEKSTGLENYRAFCRARSQAFEAEFGEAQFSRLSAASAVGAGDDRLSVIFAATTSMPRHLENPAQVAAYRYPAEHGPRAPSFARATVTADGRTIFVSGTASIKGHETVAPGDTLRQVDCTLDNLAVISRVAGLGSDLGASAGDLWTRHFKVYLRHASDLAVVRARLEPSFFRASDVVSWLQADICRAALNVEIEATLVAG